MFKTFLGIFLCLFSSFVARADEGQLTADQKAYILQEFGVKIDENLTSSRPLTDEQRAREESYLKEDLKDPAFIAARTDRAVEGWVRVAAFILKLKGHDKEAAKIENEYFTFYSTASVDFYNHRMQAVGDHPPASEWLQEVYDYVESVLGERTMALFHLDDIKTVNYCIPVVFNPEGEVRVEPVVSWGQAEYSLHFDPFAGVLGYWTTYIACLVATYGGGVALPFICTPIGQLTRKVVEYKIAPPLGERIYCRANADEC